MMKTRVLILTAAHLFICAAGFTLGWVCRALYDDSHRCDAPVTYIPEGPQQWEVRRR